jgi:hypothetical protein
MQTSTDDVANDLTGGWARAEGEPSGWAQS